MGFFFSLKKVHAFPISMLILDIRPYKELEVSTAYSEGSSIFSFKLPHESYCERKDDPPFFYQPLFVRKKIMLNGTQRAPIHVIGVFKSGIIE